MRLGKILITAIFFSSAIVSLRPAAAADLALKASPGAVGGCSDIVVACENGRQYPLCPIAVSVAGEIVTAALHTGYGATHVRLVPMSVGYRYAGRGVRLDGFRNNAILNFGEHVQIDCTIEHP